MVRYIKIDTPSQEIGHKYFLQTQVDLLEISKRMNNLFQLQQQGLDLRTAVRNKIQELQTHLLVFEKSIPNIKNPDLSDKKVHAHSDIEHEINVLKNRIAALGSD